MYLTYIDVTNVEITYNNHHVIWGVYKIIVANGFDCWNIYIFICYGKKTNTGET